MYKSRARFSPRALLVKGAAWILVEGKGNAFRVFEPMTSEQQFDAFLTWISVGELHGSEGCYMFCDDNKTKTYEATGQSSSIAGNKTKKSSDESPTDQKHRLGDRADQAYRFQLIVRSISFGCLIFGGACCSIFPFFGCVRNEDLLGCSSAKLHFKVLCSCYSTL